MRSSEPRAFVPLGEAARSAFRPLGTEAASDPHAPALDAAAAAYEAGRTAGLADARAEQALVACELESMLAELQTWRADLRTRYAPLVVSLAVEIARQIVGEELRDRPERWRPVVAAAMRRLIERERVTVRVSPRLATLVRAHAPAMAEGELRIVEDATLAPDVCRIESETTGEGDRTVGAQLAALAQALGATP